MPVARTRGGVPLRMGFEQARDRAVMLEARGFGEAEGIDWRNTQGNWKTGIAAIYDAQALRVLTEGELAVAESDPMVLVQSADVAGIRIGETIIAAGQRWTIKELPAEDKGMQTIMLELANAE